MHCTYLNFVYVSVQQTPARSNLRKVPCKFDCLYLLSWPHYCKTISVTAHVVSRYLDDISGAVVCRYPVARTGLVASLGSGSPIVGLRADMDALPIQEQADVPFRYCMHQVFHCDES